MGIKVSSLLSSPKDTGIKCPALKTWQESSAAFNKDGVASIHFQQKVNEWSSPNKSIERAEKH
jgi:hypothetical protein